MGNWFTRLSYIKTKGFKWWLTCAIPGYNSKKHHLGHALYWHWVDLKPLIPLLGLFSRRFIQDLINKDNRKTCGCGRTWIDYRLKPAVFGNWNWHGGGC